MGLVHAINRQIISADKKSSVTTLADLPIAQKTEQVCRERGVIGPHVPKAHQLDCKATLYNEKVVLNQLKDELHQLKEEVDKGSEMNIEKVATQMDTVYLFFLIL